MLALCGSVCCTGEIFIRDRLARDEPSLIRGGVLFVLLYQVNIFAGVCKSLAWYLMAMDSFTGVLKCQWTKVYVDVVALNGHPCPVAYHFYGTRSNEVKYLILRCRGCTCIVYWSI